MHYHSNHKAGNIIMLTLLSGIFTCLLNCSNNDNSEHQEPPVQTDIGKAHVWLTKGDKTKLLNKEGDLSIKEQDSSNWPVIVVDTTIAFQAMEGFGAALTGSSAYLLHKKMNAATRQTTLHNLFDPVSEIGISYLRLTIGASDFSLSDFTYDDIPISETDFDLNQFSLGQDYEDVIPVLKEIIQIAPDIRLIGSPWSPPPWMKTNGSMKGGKLKTTCYDVCADYFVRYIQEMKNEGITITAITPQNEPLYFTATYPCMEMQPGEQLDFIKNHLGPKFESAGIDTKIIIYDHNWDNMSYAISILNDPEASKYISGTAFHAYAGDVSAMSTVHNAHPDKDLYFTEISGGAWATDFSSNLMWFMRNILIGTALNWSNTSIFWNLVLDQNYGPQNNGCSNCRGVVTLNLQNGQITKNEEYYSIAHFSKFVRPGAVRVSSDVPLTLVNIGVVVFLNTDGTKVLVVSNYGSNFKTFSVKQGKNNFDYSIAPLSVATILW
ncbi:MAG: glucan endo-1,6-beta-glucosidase [Bacteroidetes bacterium]|nr:glucan endo-1,6-beta-glucosidase [Bacteroidota bacterium]